VRCSGCTAGDDRGEGHGDGAGGGRAGGIDIWAAPTWDTSDVWVPTLRHIAKEGRMYVIGVAPLLRGSDVPADLPGRDELYADLDAARARRTRMEFDPVGH
jgi:hypothetical protein